METAAYMARCAAEILVTLLGSLPVGDQSYIILEEPLKWRSIQVRPAFACQVPCAKRAAQGLRFRRTPDERYASSGLLAYQIHDDVAKIGELPN